MSTLTRKQIEDRLMREFEYPMRCAMESLPYLKRLFYDRNYREEITSLWAEFAEPATNEFAGFCDPEKPEKSRRKN